MNKARMTTLVATGAAAAAAVSLGTANQAHADGVWDRVAKCESGGNWNTNTGNGFRGGLQFTSSTWSAFGGTGSAHNASKSEQIRVAKKVLAGQGPGAWPVCSKRAGLTRGNGGADSSNSSSSTERSSRSSERKAYVAPKAERKTYTKTYSAPKAERKTYVAPKAERKTYTKTYSAPKAERKTYVAPKAERKTYVAPKATAPSAVKSSGETITVKSGDTLAKLAAAHGADSWRQLWAANTDKVNDPNLILVGQVLNLPA